jgi:hypothetical protein
MAKQKNKVVIPLPKGVKVGDQIRYYSNGWRVGTLEKVQGNQAGIHTCGTYLHPDTGRLKWIGIIDIRILNE